MDQSIVLRTEIGAHLIVNQARVAFAGGAVRDDHAFNLHEQHAISVWQAEWDRLAAQQALLDVMKPKMAGAS